MDKFDIHAWKFAKLIEEIDSTQPNYGEHLAYEVIGPVYDDLLKATPEQKKDFINTMADILMFDPVLEEKKDDRCTRIAKRKYDVWPSAYASGAVVRCRKGEIWKDEK